MFGRKLYRGGNQPSPAPGSKSSVAIVPVYPVEEERMRKSQELSRSDTCMAHAHPEEMTFVLLGRDAAAPETIRAWCRERIRLGKNDHGDAQIKEALECANTMEAEGRKWVDRG